MKFTFGRVLGIMLRVAIIVACVQIIALWPRLGWDAFFNYISIGGLSFHTYDVILYPLFALLALKKMWGERWPWALFFVWGANEIVFNTTYSIVYPASVHVLENPSNISYLAMMGVFLVIGWMGLRPRRVAVGFPTFAFPFFLAIWVWYGAPLLVGFPTYMINYAHWYWEVAYQLTLFITFVYTTRPLEATVRRREDTQ